MARYSLAALFAFDLSKSFKNNTLVDERRADVMLRELHEMASTVPDVFRPAGDAGGLAPLIGCLCGLLQCKLPQRLSAAALRLVLRLVEANQKSGEFLPLVLPGLMTALYRTACLANDPVLVPVETMALLLDCIFALAKASVSDQTSTVGEPSVCRLETVCNSFLMKMHACSLDGQIYNHLCRHVCGLILATRESLSRRWYPNLFGFLFRYFAKASCVDEVCGALRRSANVVGFLNGCLMDPSSYSHAEHFTFYGRLVLGLFEDLSGCMIKSDHAIKPLRRRILLPLDYQSDPASKVEQFRLAENFDIPELVLKFARLVPFRFCKEMLYNELVERASISLKSGIILALYADAATSEDLLPFVNVFLEHSLYKRSTAECNAVVMYLLGVFVSKHTDLAFAVSSVAFPLISQLFSDDILLSHIAGSALQTLSSRLGFGSCKELVVAQKDTLLKTIHMAFYFGADDFQDNCSILCNLMRIVGAGAAHLVHGPVLFLVDQIKRVDAVGGAPRLAGILQVFDMFFLVHSAGSSHDARSSHVDGIALELLRTTKHILSKDCTELQFFTLRILQHSLPFVSRIEKEFLPLVHEYWQLLMKRISFHLKEALSSEGTAVLESCLDIAGLFCTYCGDFVQDRVGRELLPMLRLLHGRISPQKTLSFLNAACSGLQLRDPFVHAILQLIFPILSKYEGSEQVLLVLIRRYPSMLWYYLNVYSSGSHCYANQSDALLSRIDFSLLKRTGSIYNLDRYLDMF